MVTIPISLQCIMQDGYSFSMPPAKRYLGDNSEVVNGARASIVIDLPDVATKNDFWNFWETDINYGADQFFMTMNIFGYNENLVVKASEITESRTTSDSSEVSFEIKIFNIEKIGV